MNRRKRMKKHMAVAKAVARAVMIGVLAAEVILFVIWLVNVMPIIC